MVPASERCLRTATGELSLDNPFALIEGHPDRFDGEYWCIVFGTLGTMIASADV
jgi:hypothetical protein